MVKTTHVLVIVALMVLLQLSTSLSYAHPDVSGILFEVRDGTIPDITVIGLKDAQEKSNDIGYDFLTQEWFSQNVVLLLSGIILIIIGITVVTNFREELFLKIMKGSMGGRKNY
ncbi:MAG: hypothetical protein ACRBB2_04690 [Nitrosopumilus sp.]